MVFFYTPGGIGGGIPTEYNKLVSSMESGMAKAPSRMKTKILVQKMYPVPILFSAAAYVCHNIAVMNSGKIVEYGSPGKY
jgi:hypothetical protein